MKTIGVILLICFSAITVESNCVRRRPKRDDDCDKPAPMPEPTPEPKKEREWGYRNDVPGIDNILPGMWFTKYPACYGRSQSPIDIPTNATLDNTLAPLAITQVGSSLFQEYWKVENNGHTFKMESNRKYQFTSEGQTYEFLQMHYHWRGSEHRIKGSHYDAELHLVHKSLNTSDFAVIGFMIELADDDNVAYEPLFRALRDIRPAGAKTQTTALPLDSLVPTMNPANYYRYRGSLTTPGCDEVVNWHLVDSPVIRLSERQMVDFQTLKDKYGINQLGNSRPVQPLNGRVVRKSFASMV